jgi:hypothetical protein
MFDSPLYNMAVIRDFPLCDTAGSQDSPLFYMYRREFFKTRNYLGIFNAKFENILGGLSGGP